MGNRLKPIDEQVMVITGADSGIGLATALAAAARGARVVLVSRNEEALAEIGRRIHREGGQAVWAAADVADEVELGRVAELAVREFGRIDTWVNNAGVSIYGQIERVPLEDARRLFETNYWGTVNGSLAALPYLKAEGGCLINVGSMVSDRAIPLQGHYAASKHAVKGFTDALRMELEKEGAPVQVTLVKPGAIDTPFPHHARNYMEREPRHPPPVYRPEVVADAILECAEHPTRDVTVGGGGKMVTLMSGLSARMTDRYMEATLFRQQQRSDRPTRRQRADTLYAPPARTGRTDGDQPGRIRGTSAYTEASLHPGRALLALAVVGAAAAVATGRLRLPMLSGGNGGAREKRDVPTGRARVTEVTVQEAVMASTSGRGASIGREIGQPDVPLM